jgi:predicted nucleic acid-binding protein
MRAVMDTNVLVAGLRSRNGASFEWLRLLRAGKWTLVLSNTVLAEYEEVLKRERAALGLSLDEVDKALDALCLLAERRAVSSQWTPILNDPCDEPLVHLACETKVDCVSLTISAIWTRRVGWDSQCSHRRSF